MQERCDNKEAGVIEVGFGNHSKVDGMKHSFIFRRRYALAGSSSIGAMSRLLCDSLVLCLQGGSTCKRAKMPHRELPRVDIDQLSLSSHAFLEIPNMWRLHVTLELISVRLFRIIS